MAGYVIGHITVKNPQKWAEYRVQVPSTLHPWGGEVILRGRNVAVLSGKHAYTDTVVIRFPDAGAAKSWYQSEAYQALIALRDLAADIVLVCYES